MTEPNILTDRPAQGVRRITLNRPDRLNSFSLSMLRNLRAAFDEAIEDEAVRAIVLTGTGRGFSAGQSLNDIEFLPDDHFDNPAREAGASLSQRVLGDLYNPLIETIASAPKPVVCAVNGIAAGAGANMALACDMVMAASSAKFIQAFANVALVPDCGGTWMLPRLIGRARALGLMMTAQPITAQQALDWGMIWDVVEDGELADGAVALAQNLAAKPGRTLGAIKRAVLSGETQTFADQLNEEVRLQGEAFDDPDFAEGISAFREGRPPQFQ